MLQIFLKMKASTENLWHKEYFNVSIRIQRKILTNKPKRTSIFRVSLHQEHDRASSESKVLTQLQKNHICGLWERKRSIMQNMIKSRGVVPCVFYVAQSNL